MPIEPHVQVSEDGLTVAVKCAVSAGEVTFTYDFEQPVTPANLAKVVAAGCRAAETLEPGAESHRRTIRRIPLGTLYLGFSAGPPTWRRPVVEIGRWRVLAGWLRWSVAAQWDPDRDETPHDRNANTNQPGAQDGAADQRGSDPA